jgi:Phosphotransferase enzyme family
MSAHASTTLRSVVGRLVGAHAGELGDVRREPLVYDAFLAGRTLVRLRGTVGVEGRSVRWSVIEKRTDGLETASPYLVDNAVREAAAYRSGLLMDLADGLRAPQLLGIDEAADGQLTLWLEDLAPDGRAALGRDELLQAARHLGRLAGRWIGRVPDHPWLFRGWIERHSQPHAVADGIRVVADALDDREVSGRLGGRLAEAVRLIEGQDRIGSILEQLPATLCHHDAVAANVFARRREGAPESVLIDWESVGPGPVGADLASLLFSSARRGDIPSAWLSGLFPAALEAYRHGLSDVAAAIDADEVALGVHASVALRWTLVRDVVRALGERTTVFRGSAPHETPEQALTELVALVSILLDSAAEAARLNRQASRLR